MDPNTTLETMRDRNVSHLRRLDAARHLETWLIHGGFVPQGLFPPGVSYGGHTAARLAAIRQVNREADRIADDLDALRRGR